MSPVTIFANRLKFSSPCVPPCDRNCRWWICSRYVSPQRVHRPSILIENLAAVRPVDGVHEPSQARHALCDAAPRPPTDLRRILRSKRVPGNRHPAYFVAGQHFSLLFGTVSSCLLTNGYGTRHTRKAARRLRRKLQGVCWGERCCAVNTRWNWSVCG